MYGYGYEWENLHLHLNCKRKSGFYTEERSEFAPRTWRQTSLIILQSKIIGVLLTLVFCSTFLARFFNIHSFTRNPKNTEQCMTIIVSH